MSTEATAHPTLLLVHGAWHGSWCWDKLRAVLGAEGIPTCAVDLPSVGGRSGIAEDVRVIRAALAEIEGPVMVVAHSYGGIPVTQAISTAENVVHVVYLAAFQLDSGESLLGFYGAPAPSDPDAAQEVPGNPVSKFYADIPHSEAEKAAARLRPQSTKSFSDAIEQAGWRDIPSSYIVCEKDQAIPTELQETLASRSDEVHRLPSSHSPFMSMPEELSVLLSRIALDALA